MSPTQMCTAWMCMSCGTALGRPSSTRSFALAPRSVVSARSAASSRRWSDRLVVLCCVAVDHTLRRSFAVACSLACSVGRSVGQSVGLNRSIANIDNIRFSMRQMCGMIFNIQHSQTTIATISPGRRDKTKSGFYYSSTLHEC